MKEESTSSLQRTRLRSPLNSISLDGTFEKQLMFGTGHHLRNAHASAGPGQTPSALIARPFAHSCPCSERPAARMRGSKAPQYISVRARRAASCPARESQPLEARRASAFNFSPAPAGSASSSSRVPWASARGSGFPVGGGLQVPSRPVVPRCREASVPSNPSLQRTRLRSPLNSISLGNRKHPCRLFPRPSPIS
jgi:hypothetical protein